MFQGILKCGKAFVGFARLLTRHRQLTWEMTKREISERYAGQVLGVLWAVGHPLILMGVYVAVFSVIFQIRVTRSAEMPLDYATYILAGMIPWLTFQEALNKSATVILRNVDLVKQVVFPIEILPVKCVLAAFLTQLVSLGFFVTYCLVRHGVPPATYALLPLLMALQVLGMTGVAYVLSCMGAYFKDAKDFVQVLCTINIYLLPIIYLPAMIPQKFMPVLYANPFSHMVWCYQDVLYFGRIAHPVSWIVFAVLCLVSFVVGDRMFDKAKNVFGNFI